MTTTDDIRQAGARIAAAQTARQKCRHCRRFRAQPDRQGLCFNCYHEPAIRNRYATDWAARLAQDKTAATREAKRLEACADDELPCGACSVQVKVTPAEKRRNLTIRCTWTWCAACKESVAHLRAEPQTRDD